MGEYQRILGSVAGHLNGDTQRGDLNHIRRQGVSQDRECINILEEEFRSAWQLVGQILSEAGLDYTNIIEFTSYHVGLQEHIGTFMKVKDEFVQEPYPAWTAIGITELAVPGALVEIRVVAG